MIRRWLYARLAPSLLGEIERLTAERDVARAKVRFMTDAYAREREARVRAESTRPPLAPRRLASVATYDELLTREARRLDAQRRGGR